MSLRYLYAGPKPHKRGRPQKYAGKVDLKNLDMSGKSTDMRFNDTVFKELSLYGVRAVA